jgi:hypothetical protein
MIVGLVASTMLTAPAFAQAVTPAERAQMQAELRELNAMKVEFDQRIRKLEQRLNGDLATGAGGTAPAAATAAVQTPAVPATTLPDESAESGTYAEANVSGKSLEIYGFAQLDYIQDFKRVDPKWDATLRPSKIPTTAGAFGDDGQAILSVRQTRFGVKAAFPAGDRELKTQFEFDLFGVGVDAGQTTFRLRHAWGSWGPVLAGQTNSLFMDGDLFPNTIDYWGPSGMVFLRNPQIRYTFKDSDGLYFAMALETANTDVDVGQLRELDPALGDNLRGKTPLPDLTMQARVSGDWGHLQVAGLLTKLAYSTDGTPDNEPKDSVIGGGVNVSAILNAGKSTVFRLGVVYGNGIASYMNDGGVDLAPELDASRPLGIGPQAVPLIGVSAYVDHNWSPKFSSALGYSITKVWNTDLQQPDAFESGQYASTNLLWYPVKNVMIGSELLWGKRTDFGGASGDDVRLQFSFKYNFSTGNLLERNAK